MKCRLIFFHLYHFPFHHKIIATGKFCNVQYHHETPRQKKRKTNTVDQTGCWSAVTWIQPSRRSCVWRRRSASGARRKSSTIVCTRLGGSSESLLFSLIMTVSLRYVYKYYLLYYMILILSVIYSSAKTHNSHVNESSDSYEFNGRYWEARETPGFKELQFEALW